MSAPSLTQAAALSQRFRNPPRTRGPDEPTVLIESALSASMRREAAAGRAPSALVMEQNLVAHFERQKQKLKDELGYADYTQPGALTQAMHIAKQQSGLGIHLPFMAKRSLAHMIYQGEMDWRAALYGGIWEHSNIHMPMVRRFVQQQAARTNAYFFGTQPWFSADPVGKQDVKLAGLLGPWAKFEATEAQCDSVLARCLDNVFIQGEQVVQPVFESSTQFYREFLEVAFFNDGTPVITQGGDYVYKSDTWVAAAHPITGEEIMVLSRDGITPKPAQPYVFKRELVDRKLEQFAGARLLPVNYHQFLCPLNAPSTKKANAQFKLYSEQLISVISRLAAADMGPGLSPEEARERVTRLIHEFSQNSADTAPENRPRLENMEAHGLLGADTQEPTITIADGWGHHDVFQDGSCPYVFIMMDDTTNRPIYYEYAAVVAKWNKGFAPFIPITINQPPDRWHGRGQVELFYKLQHHIDLFLNRWNFSQMSAGRLDVINRNAIVELPAQGDIKLNTGQMYSLREPLPKEQVVWSHVFSNVTSQDIQPIFQTLLQMATNMSGVTTVNDASMAGLDMGKLATGVRNIEQSGQELNGAWINQIRPAVEELMRAFLKLSAETLQTDRAFTYFEGEVPVEATISPDMVKDLELNITLDLTRYKAQQTAEQSMAAWTVIKEFYTALPPEAQASTIEFVRKWLKDAYQVANADELISMNLPPPPVDGAMPMTAQPQALPAPDAPGPRSPEPVQPA